MKSGFRPRPCGLLHCSVPLLLVTLAVNALIVLADGRTRAKTLAAGACAPITEKVDRLACYDKLANQPAPHPFRGANAPAL